jgi:hypothetical protein
MIRSAPERGAIAAIVLMICLGGPPHLPAMNPQSIDNAVSRDGNDSGQEETDSRRTKDEARSARSIGDRFLATARTPVVASVSFLELYTPAFSATPGKHPFVGFTMVRPHIYAHTGTKKYDFQFDYTFGYRGNNRDLQLHSSDHSLKIDFVRRLSRHVSLQFSDLARSVFNDEAALPDSPSAVLYQPGFAQELYVPRERLSSNSLLTSLNYQPGKKININIFGNYDFWRYSTTTFGKAQGFEVGIRSDYRINKWLYLDSSYAHYLNRVDARFLPANIHRLQVGGLKFRPRRSVEFYISGGVDSTSFQGVQLTTGAVQGGISKNSGSTLLSLVYHRGLSVAGGPGTLLNSDTVTASFSQWLSRRVNVNFNAGYVRGASVTAGRSALRYISGTGEIGLLLQRHVMFSTQYAYISQRGTNLGSPTPLLNRYTLSAGFQLFFAAIGNRQRVPVLN